MHINKNETSVVRNDKKSNIKYFGYIVCLVAAFFYCYEYLLRIAPGAMVSELMQAFDLRAETFGALISLYYLAYTPTQVVVGVVNDYYGPRRVLIFAIIMCILGSGLFGMADTILVASIGRFMIGFGSAFAFVSAMKLASVWLPANRFALFAGMITSLGMLGGMFGNIGMTAFVENVGWQHTYTIGAISGIVLLIAIILVVKDSPDPEHHASAKHIGLSGIFKGILAMSKNAQIWVAGMIGCMLYLSLSVFAELWSNEFVEVVYGLSKVDASKITSMVFFGWLIGAPVMGFISDRLRQRRLPLVISTFFSLVFSLVIISGVNMSEWLLACLFFFFGMACSVEVLCFVLGKENAPKVLSGAAIAAINLMVMCSGIFQPVVGKLLDFFWTGGMQDGIRQYTALNYEYALLILPVGCLISFILSLFIRETHAKQQGGSLGK